MQIEWASQHTFYSGKLSYDKNSYSLKSNQSAKNGSRNTRWMGILCSNKPNEKMRNDKKELCEWERPHVLTCATLNPLLNRSVYVLFLLVCSDVGSYWRIRYLPLSLEVNRKRKREEKSARKREKEREKNLICQCYSSKFDSFDRNWFGLWTSWKQSQFYVICQSRSALDLNILPFFFCNLRVMHPVQVDRIILLRQRQEKNDLLFMWMKKKTKKSCVSS